MSPSEHEYFCFIKKHQFVCMASLMVTTTELISNLSSFILLNKLIYGNAKESISDSAAALVADADKPGTFTDADL